MTPSPTAFHIDVPARTLHDLARRLRQTRWPEPALGRPWEDGTDQAFLERLTRYWREAYDWRARERSINALPQYRASVGGLTLHYVHVRGQRRRGDPPPLPLVLTHGWPGSFLEFRKLIPLLTDPERHGADPGDAFDVVAPSLPGFGFSARPPEIGLTITHVAGLWTELMTAVLGYETFVAHGSDIGANVTSLLGLTKPERVAAIHVSSVTGSGLVRYLDAGAPPLTAGERRFLRTAEEWTELEGGYAHVQRTRPQTLAYGLTDSPVGLAAWIVEKYRAWSDCEGDVERRFSLDELLDTVMTYWVTNTIASSVRLYYEGRLRPRRLRPGERVEVPTGVAIFPADIAHPSRSWGERAYAIHRWTEMPRGGHFPAFEEPELLANELREFFRPFRAARAGADEANGTSTT